MKFRGKKLIASLVLLFVAVTGGVVAQNLEKGIDFYEAGMLETAKVYFTKETGTNPSSEAYRYLADTYLRLKEVDSAKEFYNKSLELDGENVFAKIGLGKVELLKGNRSGADAIFNDIKKDKKLRRNPDVYVSMAEGFYINENLADAEEMLNEALNQKRNHARAYLLRGDLHFKQKSYSKALEMYSQAMHFDKANKAAMLRTGIAYQQVNKDLSEKMFSDIIALDPEYAPVYAELADFNYKQVNMKAACEAYEKLENVQGIPVSDRVNYISALYFSGNYAKSLEKAEELLLTNPEQFVANRLRMYNNYALDNVDAAYSNAQTFFNLGREEENYVAFDYVIYGRLAMEEGEEELAIEMFSKAMQKDEKYVSLGEEVIYMYDSKQEYDKAMAAIERYLALENNDADALDYYRFGQIYYKAATEAIKAGDIEKNLAALDNAEKMYDKVIELNGDNFLGYQGKARALHAKDPEVKEGLAMPVYKTVIEKIMTEDDPMVYKSVLMESYRFLINYYYLQDDNATVLEYCEKALEIDPDNKDIKSIMEHLQ